MIKEDRNGIIRHENGHWAGGQSGNPKGRPRQSATEEGRRAVEPLLPKAQRNLEKALDEGAVWATLEVYNRYFGKTTDRIELSHGNDALGDLSDEQIDNILSTHELPALDDGDDTAESVE